MAVKVDGIGVKATEDVKTPVEGSQLVEYKPKPPTSNVDSAVNIEGQIYIIALPESPTGSV